MSEKKRFLADCLHVFVLTGFAIVQPALHLLSRQAVFLLDQNISIPALITLVMIVSVLMPLVLLVMEWLVGRISQGARQRTHVAVIFCLLVPIALPVLKPVMFLDGMTKIVLTIALAVLSALAYHRYTIVRHLVTAATPAILVFPGVFFFHSPITRLLFPPPQPPPVHRNVSHPVPVVMVVFDEFCGTSLMDEHHEIDADRYPNFAALARDATWYRNATCVQVRTEKAVPAILTGKFPEPLYTPTTAHHPDNLFTLMLTTEYELTVFEPFTRLFPDAADEDVEEVAPRGFFQQMYALLTTLPRVYLNHVLPYDLPLAPPDIPMEWYAIKHRGPEKEDKRTGVFRRPWESDRHEQFEQFLRCIVASDQPALYFSHIVVPHHHWCYLPSGRRYMPDFGPRPWPYGSHGLFLETWGSDELAVHHAYQRYLLQVGYVDSLVGRLIAKLKQADLYDRSLIILIADHGVSFRPNQSRRMTTKENLPDIASIPLFIKQPHQQAGGIDDRAVEQLDVLPTIVQVLGLEMTPEFDGQSLLNEADTLRDVRLFQSHMGDERLDTAFEAKYDTLDRMLKIFGSGADPERFFKIGPHPELIGQDVKDLDVVGRSDLQLEIDNTRGLWGESRDLVPCYFNGRVHGKPDTKLPVELAIAVNGTIRATTRTYLDSKVRDVWSAMVPESSLREGENEIQFLVVTADDGKLTLAPVGDDHHRESYVP